MPRRVIPPSRSRFWSRRTARKNSDPDELGGRLPVKGLDAVYVATDDDRIADAARGFGAQVVMTDPACENGTARCADALRRSGIEADLIVNFQGDAPLTPPWFVEELVAAIKADEAIDMATPVLRCDRQTYDAFRQDRAAGRVGGTTAVFDAQMNALYFSKEVAALHRSGQGARPDSGLSSRRRLCLPPRGAGGLYGASPLPARDARRA